MFTSTSRNCTKTAPRNWIRAIADAFNAYGIYTSFSGSEREFGETQ